MARRTCLLGGLCVALAAAAAWRCYGQYEVESDARQARAYRVRVINEMGRAICVKIIPYGHSNYYHADLGRGESETRDLWAGQRALCAWDDRNGQLLIVASVNINRNGRLRIRPQFAAAPAEARAAEQPRGVAPAGIPSLEIERE